MRAGAAERLSAEISGEQFVPDRNANQLVLLLSPCVWVTKIL
jgi:hypothetical protein